MKKVELIDTEIGKVPIVISKVKQHGEINYNGRIIGENNIFIQTRTEAFCIDQLKKAFELSIHFWLRNELFDIQLKYEGKISKNWYNEWQKN